MAMQQAVDGRQALAWILEPVGDAVSTALKVGDIVFVKTKAESGSKFGNTPVNKPFIATEAISTLTDGDTYVKCLPYFMGFATDKSLNKSKNTTEVTMDYDEAQNFVSDGITQISGSVSGSFVIEGAKYASTMLKQRFGAILDATGTGVTVHEAKTTEKDIIMFCWNARDAKANDVVEIEIVPAFFTSLAIGGSYGSPQTFNVDFNGNATDENNFEGATLMVKNVAGLLPAFTRSGAEKQSKKTA